MDKIDNLHVDIYPIINIELSDQSRSSKIVTRSMTSNSLQLPTNSLGSSGINAKSRNSSSSIGTNARSRSSNNDQ